MNIQAAYRIASSFLRGCFLIFLGLVFPSFSWAQCNPGDVGGMVFHDVPAADASTPNVYAELDANEAGLTGIFVSVTDANGITLYDTTDVAGNWSVTPAAFPVRVEFSWNNNWLEISPGKNSNSDVQLLDGSDCAVQLGMYYPDEYCEMVPEVATTCYVSGDPMGGGTTGAVDAIISFPFDANGDVLVPNPNAAMAEVGAVWGAAYNRYHKEAFFASVMKRHVGLGPAGLGGLYRVDYSGASPAASSFINLSFLGVDVGTEPARILNADYSNPGTDSLMFDAPGKIGLGGMAISDDGNTLFVVNLHTKRIITVDLTNYYTTGALPGTAQIDSLPDMPNILCINGESRPFAVTYRRGKLYVGSVCSGENGGTITDLYAVVSQYDFSTGLWSQAINPFSLNYNRGGAIDNICTAWEPWIDTYDNVTTDCRPTPLLTNIDFDSDNTMLLGFADRYTFQKFSLQRDSADTAAELVVNGGEVLYAYFNGTNYALESGGTIPAGGGCGLNGQGLGGGEYFCGDSINTDRSEISQGALAVVAGTGELLSSTINPVNYNSGGVRRFNMTTGTSSTAMGYQLYETTAASFPTGNGYAVEGGGLGDLLVLRQAPPIELVSFIWEDIDADGVQDPDESGIANVEVSLFDINGNLQWVDTTNANGTYSFSDTLVPFTTFYVAIGTDGGFNTTNTTLNDSLMLTLQDTGMGNNTDKNDSDVAIAAGIHANIDGYPYYSFTTGAAGQLFHYLDAGFYPPCTDPDLVTVDTTVCNGNAVDLNDLVTDANATIGTYSYYNSFLDANAETSAIAALVSPADTTMYYVRKNTSDPLCFDIDSMTVNSNPNPILLTNDITICAGDTISLLVGVIEITGQSVNLDYYLSFADAMAETNPLAGPVVFPSDTTKYYIRANTVSSPICFDIDSLTLAVNDCSFDLALKLVLATGQNATINPGDTVTYTMWVYNQGGLVAHDIALMTYMSTGVNFDNTIGMNANWDQVGNTLIDTIVGPLAIGDSIDVDVSLVVDPFYSGSSLTNFAEITGYDDDTDDGNTPPVDDDSVTDTNGLNDLFIDNEINDNPDNPFDDDDHDAEIVFINQIIDLALLVETPTNPVSPCDTLTYSMWVYNQGNADVFDIVLTDYLPVGLLFDPTLPNNANWQLVSGNPTDTIPGPLSGGDSLQILLDLVVDCGYGNNSLDNFLEITSLDNDTDDGNTPPTDEDSDTDLDPGNDLTIDNEINDNPDDPNDDDDHDGASIIVYQGATPTTSYRYYSTLIDMSLSNLCMNVTELSGAVDTVYSCGDPVNGVLNITTPDVCVGYMPNGGFTGQDTACVLVCDVNALCDTTFLVFTVLPIQNVDTLYFSTLQNVSLTNLCMDLSELTAAVNTVAGCGGPMNGMIATSAPSECVDYVPDPGYIGQDTACIEICDVNAICDTTILVFTILPLPTTTPDTLYFSTEQNTGLTSLCMDLSELTGGVDTVYSCADPANGLLTITTPSECVDYTPAGGYIGQDTACVVVCDVNAVCDTTYLVFSITLPSTITDTLYFSTIQDVDLNALCMNLSELTGGIDTVFSCGNPTNGSLTITTASECVDYAPAGGYTGQDTACVVVCDVNTVCDTTILVFTVDPIPITTTDTLYFTTLENNMLDNLCADISELTGTSSSVSSCGDPVNGTLTIISPNECIDYTPANGYSGQDTACVVVCDVNAVCDTTIYVFTITPLPLTTTDTLYFTTLENNGLTGLCADVSELIAPVNNVSSCGDPPNGLLIISSPDECIDYQPLNGFSGQDTACVVVCDDNSLCDTTIYVFTVTALPSTTTDTLYFTTEQDVGLSGLCVDVTELLGPVANTISCGDPANGTLDIFSPSECVDYTPAGGFIGQDTACVVVCDNNMVCDTTILVFTIDPVCVNFIAEDSLQQTLLDCSADANFCLNIPIGDIGDYTILDNGMPFGGTPQACDFDTNYVYNYFSLPGQGAAGPYTVDIWVVDGVFFSGTVNDMQDLTDSMNVWNPAGAWMLDPVSFSIVGGLNSFNYSNITLTQVSTDSTHQLLVSLNLTPNGTQLSFVNGIHEVIFTEIATGCMDTLQVVVDCPNCPDLFIGTDTLMADNCNETVAFCTPIEILDFNNNYVVTDNGMPFSGAVSLCNLNAALELDTGYHILIFTDTMTNCIDTAMVEVTCIPCLDWIENDSLSAGDCANTVDYCIPIAPDDIGDYTIMDNGVDLSGSLIGCDFDSLVTYITLGFNLAGNYTLDEWIVGGTNYGGISFADPSELVDSMNVWVPGGNWVLIGLFIIGEGNVNDFGPLVVSEDGIEVASAVPTLQLSPNGVAVQLDTGMHVITVLELATGCTDTAVVIVDCVPVINVDCEFIEEEFMAFEIDNCSDVAPICLDVPFADLSDFSIIDNGNLYTGPVSICETDRVGIALGLGTHELIVTDLINDCSDTATVIIGCTTPEVIVETITVGEVDTICLDLSELPGTPVSFINFCEDASGEFVVFDEITGQYCIEFTGMEAGTDSACIEICDNLGFCDTTWIYVTAEPMANANLPDANQDSVYTLTNIPVTVVVIQNDDLEGSPGIIDVITEPEHGSILVDSILATIVYTPDPGYCDDFTPDVMTYAICNEVGCDTTEVFFFVSCDELTFVSGFSPNGDGVNDTFVIKGLSNFPNHKLLVFNRWGNQVYAAENYLNNWMGTFNDDLIDLPDGTYFYVFDDGTGNVYTGYVQIHR